MEVIIAVAIASLLMFMIVQLFNSTNVALQTGIATGNILVTSETIGDQLQRDADAMQSPVNPWATGTPAGFLVITQKLIRGADWTGDGTVVDPGVKMRHRTGATFPENKGPDGSLNYIRSDQLSFIVQAPNLTNGGTIASVTPQSTGELHSIVNTQYARVWYGHLLKVNPDGTPPGATTIDNALGAKGPNLYANQWVLGRQALLLASLDADTDPTTPTNLKNGNTYANGAQWGDAVQGSGATIYGTNELIYGLTDVADQKLTQATAPKGILDSITTYPTDIYDFALAQGAPFVNVSPAKGLEAWKLAQTHMFLAKNVSDFIVEFAGDYQTDSGLGSTGSTPDGKIDVSQVSSGTDINGLSYSLPQGTIKWYGYWYNDPETNKQRDPNNPTGTIQFDLTKPVVYPVPTGVFSSVASATATDAYEMTSTPFPQAADAVFVFRHDDGNVFTAGTPNTNSKWPYLLRIRYRLHDDNGRIQSTSVSGNRTYGKWVINIVKVRRPGVD